MEPNQKATLTSENSKMQKGQGEKISYFLKAIVFEIGFVTITLIFFFGTLNYFKVINLSHISPIFSTLPHKLQNNQSTIFPLDSKAFLAASLSKMLLPAFLPPNQLQTTTTNTQLLLNWSVQAAHLSVTITTAKKGNLQNHVLLTIQTPLTDMRLLDSVSAASFTQTYLHKQSSLPFICDSTKNRVFCQQTSKTQSEKISIGVRENLFSTASARFVIIACHVPSTNILFDSNNPCF